MTSVVTQRKIKILSPLVSSGLGFWMEENSRELGEGVFFSKTKKLLYLFLKRELNCA